jgi:hypothetical protein
MGPGEPRHVAIAGEQRLFVFLYFEWCRRQQRQRQQAERAIGDDDEIFGGLPAAFDWLQQQLVEFIAELEIEGWNIRDHRRLRLERLA